MMQGFYLLARRRARLRAAAAAVFLLCAAVLAGAAVHASCAPEAVPAAANALVAGQDGEVIVTTAIDVRTLPGADREALERGIPLENEQALTQLLEDYS